jgi:sporulation protein YlmC with PRC-barrel domain
MLANLKRLEGFEIVDPSSDIRGWRVTRRDGRPLGTVDDLVVETSLLEVRYLVVQPGHDRSAQETRNSLLVPARATRLNHVQKNIVIDYVPAAGFAGAPRSSGDGPTPAEERAIRDYFTPAARMRRNDDEDTLDYPRFWSSGADTTYRTSSHLYDGARLDPGTS